MTEIENRPAKPGNYLVLAILCTVCCCLPAGVVSIVYASKVNEAYERGEYEAAEKHSRNARTWGIVGVVVGGLAMLVYVAIIVFAAVMDEGGF